MLAVVWVIAAATYASALTVDQVIALRKAGVSDAVIQQMIRNELGVAARGGVGRYVTRTSGGREIIVYHAGTPGGAAELDTGLSGGALMEPAARQALGVHKPAAKPKPGGEFTLHLGSHREAASAEAQAARLKAQGVMARVQKAQVPGKGLWHRVLVGRFKSKAAAEGMGDKLRQAGSIGSFVVLAL